VTKTDALLGRVRNFWNSRPCNIRHSKAPVGSRQFFEETAARRYFVEQHIPVFADFPKWSGKKVLEIGCGIGTDAIQFGLAGAKMTMIELSDKSIDVARQGFTAFGLSGRFLNADAEELSKHLPPGDRFDLIYSFGVIHHSPHPERILKELQKYCHPQTELRIMLYAKWSWKVLWIIVKFGKGRFWRTKKLVAQYSEAQEGSPVTHIYSGREARRLMKDYEIVSMEKTFIFPYRIKDYIEHRYVKEWYFRWMPDWVFRRLTKYFGWHLLITARPKPT